MTLLSTVNMHTYRNTFDEPGDIEISIASPNYYIIFIEAPLNTTLSEYRGDVEDDLILVNKTNVYDIQLYRFVEYPFAKHVISIPTAGTISFSYGSLQDMCQDGLILTNYDAYTIVFSSHFNNETSVNNGDDKCIIFTNPSPTQMYLFDLTGVNGRVIVYESGKAVTEFTGTASKYSTFDASDSPVIVRILSNPLLSSERIRIAMSSYMCKPYCSWTLFTSPKDQKHCPDFECTLYDALHMNEILISLGVIVGVIGIVLGVYYYKKQKKIRQTKRNTNDSNEQNANLPSISQHEKGENLSEPAGYYVMAPILNLTNN